MNEVLIPIVTSVGFFLLVAYSLKLLLESKYIKEKTRLSEKMLDKLSSSKEMVEFIKSTQGESFLQSLTRVTAGSKQKLISSLYWGIVVFFLGVGLYIIKGVVEYETRTFMALGIVVLFLGIGMLLGAVASFLLAGKWGLLNGNSKVK